MHFEQCQGIGLKVCGLRCGGCGIGGSPGQTRSHVNVLEGRNTVSHSPMNCSGTPGMGGPLAEGARTVPVGHVLPANHGNIGAVRSVEGDAQIRQGRAGNVSLPPRVSGIPVGGNPHS